MSLALAAGCGGKDSFPDDARTRDADAKCRAKWGKPLAELPTLTLAVISANSENIRNEFEWAFSLDHAVEHGQKVVFEWRSVGGGGNTIYEYLRSVYEQRDSSDIDILWGGGEFNFIPLAAKGVLEPLELDTGMQQNIPESLGAVRLMDADRRWVGVTLSAFGFIYNAGMLKRCGIAPPGDRWEDLGDRRFAGLIALADPTQSSSAAAAYQMVARSGDSWPAGWGKLLRVLANAKRFTDSAGSAANAPSLGEALVATCIDFYGAVRVAEAPDQIVYTSPRGQTAFTPDPVAILKNPPHRELAKRFVAFLLSPRGQAVWALPAGAPGGPARSALGRQPIRKDAYEMYAGKMIPSIVNPYQQGQAMSLEGHRSKIEYKVLTQLVRAAAVDNLDALRHAREQLIAASYAADMAARFEALPENVDTVEKMAMIAKELKDPVKAERIVTDWQRFFRDKYVALGNSEKN